MFSGKTARIYAIVLWKIVDLEGKCVLSVFLLYEQFYNAITKGVSALKTIKTFPASKLF